MQHRRLGKTGYEISAIGFGAWAIGGSWGQVDDPTSMRALHAAADAGVTFYDTADVYGDGHSEQLLGRFLRERSGERLIVATKMGRRVDAGHRQLHARALRWNGQPGAARTSAWTDSTWSSCTARRPTCSITRRCSRRSTTWSRRASSPTTA